MEQRAPNWKAKTPSCPSLPPSPSSSFQLDAKYKLPLPQNKGLDDRLPSLEQSVKLKSGLEDLWRLRAKVKTNTNTFPSADVDVTLKRSWRSRVNKQERFLFACAGGRGTWKMARKASGEVVAFLQVAGAGGLHCQLLERTGLVPSFQLQHWCFYFPLPLK